MIRPVRARLPLPPRTPPRAPRGRRGVAGATPKLPEHAHGHLPASQSPITSRLHFFNAATAGGKQIPTFRVLDGAGQPLEGAEVPEVRRVLFLACAGGRRRGCQWGWG